MVQADIGLDSQFTVGLFHKNKIFRGIFLGLQNLMAVHLAIFRMGALVWWLWKMTHVREVVGLNPSTVYRMDMTFLTLICCKSCIVCLKRP